MDIALREANAALQRGEVPIGCALLGPDEEVLATGSNRTNERGDATAHAELVALETLPPRSRSVSVFVTCEPCVMCAAALVQTGIVRRIIYGCANPRFGGCGSVRALDLHLTTSHSPSLSHELSMLNPTPCTNRIQRSIVAHRVSNGTTSDAYIHVIPQVTGGVRSAECLRLLSDFYTRTNPNAPNPKTKRRRI